MRSYSSVLSHVLGSHPEIDGYCETHLRYRFALDFLRLQWRVRRLTGEPLSGRFVLDKVLHNYSLVSSLLERPQARVIFLLRQPVDVLRSIVHMGTHLDSNAQNASVASATAYYVSRVNQLTMLARRMGSRAAFVESEALMNRTEDTLQFLQNFLELETPLDRRYRHFPRTGRAGSGDPSDAIRSGEIRARRDGKPRYSIPSVLVADAVQAHARCFSACSLDCVSMGDRSAANRKHVDLSLAG
jgi:hypothetical protein